MNHVSCSNPDVIEIFPFTVVSKVFPVLFLSIQSLWDIWQVKAFETECNLTWKRGGSLLKAGVCSHTSYTYNLLFAQMKRNTSQEFAASACCSHALHIQDIKLRSAG